MLLSAIVISFNKWSNLLTVEYLCWNILFRTKNFNVKTPMKLRKMTNMFNIIVHYIYITKRVNATKVNSTRAWRYETHSIWIFIEKNLKNPADHNKTKVFKTLTEPGPERFSKLNDNFRFSIFHTFFSVFIVKVSKFALIIFFL